MSEYLGKIKEKILDKYFEVVDDPKESPSIQDGEEIIESVKSTVFKVEEQEPMKQEVVVTYEPSKISKGTEIHGNLNASGDLEICGQIVGDVVSQGHVTIDGGSVIGNIHARSVILTKAKVQGNIISESMVDIYKSSDITGNISGENVTIDNYCKGDVHARNSLYLKIGASIKGNIHASKLKIDEGAVVDGQIKMNKE